MNWGIALSVVRTLQYSSEYSRGHDYWKYWRHRHIIHICGLEMHHKHDHAVVNERYGVIYKRCAKGEHCRRRCTRTGPWLNRGAIRGARDHKLISEAVGRGTLGVDVTSWTIAIENHVWSDGVLLRHVSDCSTIVHQLIMYTYIWCSNYVHGVKGLRLWRTQLKLVTCPLFAKEQNKQ